jgi:hypothetical protein
MIKENIRDLIEALEIFAKYNVNASIHCEHDTMYICYISPDEVTEKDKTRLDELGFFDSSDDDNFMSFRWGSC